MPPALPWRYRPSGWPGTPLLATGIQQLDVRRRLLRRLQHHMTAGSAADREHVIDDGAIALDDSRWNVRSNRGLWDATHGSAQAVRSRANAPHLAVRDLGPQRLAALRGPTRCASHRVDQGHRAYGQLGAYHRAVVPRPAAPWQLPGRLAPIVPQISGPPPPRLVRLASMTMAIPMFVRGLATPQGRWVFLTLLTPNFRHSWPNLALSPIRRGRRTGPL